MDVQQTEQIIPMHQYELSMISESQRQYNYSLELKFRDRLERKTITITFLE